MNGPMTDYYYLSKVVDLLVSRNLFSDFSCGQLRFYLPARIYISKENSSVLGVFQSDSLYFLLILLFSGESTLLQFRNP